MIPLFDGYESALIKVKLGVSFLVIVFVLVKLFMKRGIDEKHVCVIVLGDLGRSPRMNYHCLSFASAGYDVSFVGYKESRQTEDVEKNERIRIIPLIPYPKALQIGPRIVQYFLKMVFLSLAMMTSLFRLKSVPKYILLQNPPSIPTLLIAYIYAKSRNSKVIIDWHNYGFSILALTNGPGHILVKICRKMEIFFGRRSDINLCVTNAMKADLADRSIKAFTLYDKPHERFQPLTIEQKHGFFLKLAEKYDISSFKDSQNKNNTAFTTASNKGAISMKSTRPALIVSSSSWTEDEDFQILIDALQNYQNEISKGNSKKLPNIICALTGKGPLKEYYENLFCEKNFNNIQVIFLWLEPSDYPTLLGCADLGICLHKSSSDLDLPMKVVDMFGTTLPVCAVNFKCISELVKHDSYGKVFESSLELSQQLEELLVETDKNAKLTQYRRNLIDFQRRRWKNEWESVMNTFI